MRWQFFGGTSTSFKSNLPTINLLTAVNPFKYLRIMSSNKRIINKELSDFSIIIIGEINLKLIENLILALPGV